MIALARDDSDARKETIQQSERTMKTNYKVATALVAGAAIGGAAIQVLHAQARPPAYIVIPILKINDAGAFKAGVTDKVKPEDLKAAGGEWVIRNTEFTSLDGTPPERLVIIKFDSREGTGFFQYGGSERN